MAELRILDDKEMDALAAHFQGGNPVELPEGADVDDTLTRLRIRTWANLENVHVAEETEGDGIILMA
jgi:hypothetical protein